MKLRLRVRLPITLSSQERITELNQIVALFGDPFTRIYMHSSSGTVNVLADVVESIVDGAIEMTQERWAYLSARQHTFQAEPPCTISEPVTEQVEVVKEEQA